MSFKITARTILQLGAELISSDEVALYELVKNSIDAGSKSGVDIHFQITMLKSKYDELVTEYIAHKDDKVFTVDEFRKQILDRLYPGAPASFLAQFKESLNGTTATALMGNLEAAYTKYNNITISDTGHGMSAKDLQDIFLTIGTTSRAAETRRELQGKNKGHPTYLGEKGVGRLSAMRLGTKLKVETAVASDSRLNLLEIDWSKFEEAYDQPYDAVKLAPTIGGAKPPGFSSGTTLTIYGLRSVWTPAQLKKTVDEQISRLLDPFSFVGRRRSSIRIIFNGNVLEYGRTISETLLNSAHAKCMGKYEIIDGKPRLSIELVSSLYKGTKKSDVYDITDLKGMSEIVKDGLPSSSLVSVGPFDFELYWYNRQRIKAEPDIGDRETVRALQRQWGGILLFRDGYRVLPYGNEGDDWLMLDRTALGSPGYKLNTKQFIGRVRIGRITNPKLLDQTNRQGLQICPETSVLVNTIHDVIVDKLKSFIDECMLADKKAAVGDFNKNETDQKVAQLERRTKESLKVIRSKYHGPEAVLKQVKDAFAELNDAYTRAVNRLELIETEKERMTHLAGVGLLVEIVAHELTRATEHTQATLKDIDPKLVSQELGDTFKSLKAQLATIMKRLRILEPLSVTARNRRSYQDLSKIVEFVVNSHEAQFARHHIDVEIIYPGGKKQPIEAFVVEGMVVQILENLIANSIYWLNLYKEDHKNHNSQVVIRLSKEPPTILYHDNGPGIPLTRREVVFEPFFSTKGSSGRHGLGLYIARQNAELMKGNLTLVDEPEIRKGRLNVFELELREGVDDK